MHRRRVLIIFCMLVAQALNAQLKLPALVSDGMILQRDRPVRIWGWADAGAQVFIVFNGKKYTTTAGDDKTWEYLLPAAKAGDSATMTIVSGAKSVTVNDILFGDVWLCSGQSNMELDMSKLTRVYPQEIAGAANPHIRQFLVPRSYSFYPRKETQGNWLTANPQNIGKFTAAGYFMAKDLYAKYQVPIGLINATWGGTPAEAWISEDGLRNVDSSLRQFRYYKDTAHVNQALRYEQATTKQWYASLNATDSGFIRGAASWNTDQSFSTWRNIKVPGSWKGQSLPLEAGIVWYKKEVEITDNMLGADAFLQLGLIADQDTTYFNGVKVGATTSKHAERYYTIPAALLKKGKNIVTIRVIGINDVGGFTSGKKYGIRSGNNFINLEGNWSYRIGAAVKPFPAGDFVRMHNQPASLYNGMIVSIIPYSIKGVAWYQGEHNASKPSNYQQLLTELIKDWRSKWDQKQLPFLVVQLPNFQQPVEQPSESSWAKLREAQLRTVQSLPATALAVTIDLGEANDIHPVNKKDVGARLALAAEKIAYGEDKMVASGPIYKSMRVEGDKVYLSFTNIGGGLISKDAQPLHQFAIAGADNKFVWADARINGDEVIVSSAAVSQPVAVRYAWANNPEGCNLWNKEGLPASPFRTDVPATK